MTKFDRSQKNIERLQGSASRIVSGRWCVFFLGLLLLILFWGDLYHPTFLSLGGPLLSLFLLTSFLLSAINKNLLRWRQYQGLLQVEKYRRELNWSQLPAYRTPTLNPEEYDVITATDLHLTGQHSALHLMDSCISDHGQRTLLSCLVTTGPLDRIRQRQQKVRELLPLLIFRMKFKLLGKIHSGELIKKDTLLAAFNKDVFRPKFFVFFTLLVVLQLFNLILIFAAAIADLKPYYLLSIPLIYLLYQLLKLKSENAFELGLSLQLSLERLLPVFRMMETLPVTNRDALFSEFASFQQAPPSKLLKKLNLVVALLSVRANPLLGLTLNFLLPWDFGLLVFLQRLKAGHSAQLGLWLESLGRLEALVSLADYSANTGGIFPQFLEEADSTYLEAVNLDHPLLGSEKRVPNTYSIKKDAPISVITGSNMAGKSTFLRTIGLNVALARAGASVRAEKFSLQNLSVTSLIKAQDFLEKEMSLFYFEVKRLKEILEKGRASSGEVPCLFLVDEIYRGTNNQERYQGAVAYLREFSTVPHCCGLLTTHDINIAKNLLSNPAIKQFHFQELYRDGALVYDYKINPGICETTNALRIMEREGLPVT
ncbi:MAG TPA: hypothetical protein VNJ01_17940 [Bacteriovoracaceae bacterium]|nr:hypothetical protein [Bacteriovoracaceae bacterium]